MMHEQLFFLQHYTSHSVNSSRHFLAFELPDVLVTTRTESVSMIFMESQIKLSPMLDDRFIERGQQHMVFIIQFRHGDDQ